MILISIDTLRADRIGAYGYDRPTSPALDAFARTGVLYETAVAECSWTLPSHVTMMSGLAPATHGVVKPALRIGSDTPLLAELLRDAGYSTIGLTDGGYVGASHGFSRGFDVYDETDDTFAETVADAIARMDALANGERLFLFLHTYDVHCPYDPAPTIAAQFRSQDAAPIVTAGRCGNPHFNTMALRPGQARHISDQYDASIREMDDSLGTLIAYLRSSGRLEHTLVLITSDHGEELADHGSFGHERTLYREALMVPLVIVAPGLAPDRVAEPVGLADLAPTVLGVLGLPGPAGLEGRRLVEPVAAGGWRPASLGTRARYSELDRHVVLRSAIALDHHLILNPRAGRSELYSMTRDPVERDDLAPESDDLVRALTDSIASYERNRSTRSVETITALSDDERARLRNLGYID